MNKEIWKDIPNFEGLYQVSNLGRVRSILYNNKKILKPRKNKKGYIKYALYKNKKQKNLSCHRLVAQTFIPNPNNLPQVNHIDGNKENNKVENLEWCTNSENQQHAWNNGLQKRKIGKNVHNAKSLLQYDLDGNFIKEYDCIMDAVRELNLKNSAHIVQCCKNQRNKAYKYIWKYKEE